MSAKPRASIPQSALLSPNWNWPPVARVDNVFGDRNPVCSFGGSSDGHLELKVTNHNLVGDPHFGVGKVLVVQYLREGFPMTKAVAENDILTLPQFCFGITPSRDRPPAGPPGRPLRVAGERFQSLVDLRGARGTGTLRRHSAVDPIARR